MSCGVDHSCNLDPTWLWLYHRPAAVAPIWPLAWELPYAEGAALKQTNKTKKNSCVIANPSGIGWTSSIGLSVQTNLSFLFVPCGYLWLEDGSVSCGPVGIFWVNDVHGAWKLRFVHTITKFLDQICLSVLKTSAERGCILTDGVERTVTNRLRQVTYLYCWRSDLKNMKTETRKQMSHSWSSFLSKLNLLLSLSEWFINKNTAIKKD